MAALQGSQRAFSTRTNSLAPRSRPRTTQCRASSAGLTGCRLVGVGSSAPATVLSNQDLERYIETSDEWIQSRTGIKRRHVLGADESMAQHAANACMKAMDMAGVSPEQVDMILLATSTPDDAFGGACQVRRAKDAPWRWCRGGGGRRRIFSTRVGLQLEPSSQMQHRTLATALTRLANTIHPHNDATQPQTHRSRPSLAPRTRWRLT